MIGEASAFAPWRRGAKVFAILFALGAMSAGASSKRAPITDAVLQARTIYLINEAGEQSILDRAYREFEKWGRFNIVHDPNADLRIVFTRDFDELDRWAVRMDVIPRGEQDAAFETTEGSAIQSWMIGFLVRDYSAKRCVDDFERRLVR